MTEPRLLAWSAPDEPADEALRSRIGLLLDRPEALAALLSGHRDPRDPVRAAVVLTGADDPAAVRGAPARRLGPDHHPRPVGVLLDGHGAQHPGMAAQLYGTEPVFSRCMDQMFDAFGAAGEQLRECWLAEDPQVSIDAPERGQPLLLALGYALGRTLESWGIRPGAMLGHSVGELAAAVLAGVIAPADAARLMAARSPGYAEAAPGGLLAVAAPAAELRGFCGDGVCVGVVNSPRQTMLAGPEAALVAAERRLRTAGYAPVRARIPLPFHAPALAPLAEVSRAALAQVPLHPPRTSLYSSATTWRMRPSEATDPGFWAGQVCRPVLFGPALDRMLSEQNLLLIEAGPARALTTLARRHPAVADGHSAVTAMLPARRGPPGADRSALLDTVAALWLEGHPVNFPAVNPCAVHVVENTRRESCSVTQ